MQESVQKHTLKDFLFIQLGSEEDKAIVLSANRMKNLEELIDKLSPSELEKHRGVIFTSPPQLAFCVGADLKAIKDVTDPAEGKRLAEQGQRIFDKIENLPIPTFAAIQGHCVGGGCELALSCTYRLIANDDRSRIGLPETKLGILPGFGGTQRLPKLIGLPKAIDFIVNAKVIPGKAAYKLGLVDGFIKVENGLINNETIIEACSNILESNKSSRISFVDKLLTFTSMGQSIVASKAQKIAFKKTKGHYPAIPLAIESTLNSFKLERTEAYDKEAEYLGRLIATSVSKSLVHLFYLTEFASKMGKKSGEKSGLKSVGIIGAGVMGKGIAAVSTKSRLKVAVTDTNSQSLVALENHVKEYLNSSKSLSEAEKVRLLDNLSSSTNNEAIKNSDIIIEAATENLDIKRSIFSSLQASNNPEQIIATNTSSLMLSEVFKEMDNREKCIGVHFFNPVEKMPLLEVVRSKETSDQTVIKACSFASKLGKYPVVVEDVPGFLVNRMLSPYLAEASLLLSEGANFHELEKAVTDFGFPMGPFRLLDEVGLDVAAKVQEVLTSGYGERMKGASYLDNVLKKNLLGKKSGTGFYIHNVEKPLANVGLLNELGISTSSSSAISKEEIVDRLLTVLVLEALRAYEEEVAGKTGPEAMGQIDLASVMGFGFPPFQGGVLFYARKIGFKAIKASAIKYKNKGPRFNIPKVLDSL